MTLQELYTAAFTAPFATHRWESTRGRSHWVDLEGWQDALAGPLSSIVERGGCGYVYPREDEYFAGVDTPMALRARLLEWHARLLAGIDRFVPTTPAESVDLAFMRSIADLMKELVERGCEIELARRTAEAAGRVAPTADRISVDRSKRHSKDPTNWRAPVLPAEPDASRWVTCPGCQWRFSASDRQAWNGRRHRRCGQSIALAGQPSGVRPIWCVVGNIVDEHAHGPGDQERRRGTRHFAPGAKVYCFPPLWGDGYERIKVIGRHRGSHRYITAVIQSTSVRNWRADLVYSPTLIDLLDAHWSDTDDSRQLAEGIARTMNQPPQ